MSRERYMAIPPGAIVPGSLPRFSIYVPTSGGQYVLWAEDGNRVTEQQLLKLAEGGHTQVFIDLEEELKFDEYLETNLEGILENEGTSDEQKAAIFGKVSANVVKAAFETSLGMGAMTGDIIERTQRMVANALMFIAESRSMEALAKMIGHDYQTYEHATKVLWFTAAFLKDNGEILETIQPGCEAYDEEQRKDLLRQCGVAALLHDIGKALVAQSILNKLGPLNETEWEVMKRHPLSGMAMLFDTAVPDFVKKAVLQHHEDFQGGGYPLGIEGPTITVLGRVLRIVDVFEAMTSRRPYKEAMSAMKAVQIMVGAPSEAEDGENAVKDKRDLGMRRCFDEKLLRKFIVFLGRVRLTA